MTATRDELKGAAEDLGWSLVAGTSRYVDVFRNEPYSIMVDFSRDGVIVEARLFRDAPDPRQALPPRLLASVTKNNAGKRRRIRSWLYDHQTRVA